jgi:hypothetical protein
VSIRALKNQLDVPHREGTPEYLSRAIASENRSHSTFGEARLEYLLGNAERVGIWAGRRVDPMGWWRNI